MTTRAATGSRRSAVLLLVVGLGVLGALLAGLFAPRVGPDAGDASIARAASPSASEAARAPHDAELAEAAPRPLPAAEARSAVSADAAAPVEPLPAADDAAATAPLLLPGELRVVVRARGRPMAGTVAVHRYRPARRATNDQPAIASAPLVDGVAHFSGVPQGVLCVAAHVEAGPPYQAFCVNTNVRGHEVVVELGDASVHGRVRAHDGSDAVGATVVVVTPSVTVATTTGVDGSYVAGRHFPAGACTVEVVGEGLLDYPARSLSLTRAQGHDVSFGPGSGLVRWRGRVIASDGEPVRAGDGLASDAIDIVLRSGSAASVAVVDGAIDQWFEPGVYVVRSAFDRHVVRRTLGTEPTPSVLPAPRQLLDLAHDLEQDVDLPGAVVRGRVDPPPPPAPSAAPGNAPDEPATIVLESVVRVDRLSATIGADGSFRFVGVVPGRYELRWHPDRSHELEVSDRPAAVLEFDLTTP